MHSSDIVALSLAVLTAASAASGQIEGPAGPATTPALPTLETLGSFEGIFRAPVHREADGREIWTSGDDFKASFHDGFQFVPVLGEGYPENLPWTWHTERVQIGGVRLGDGAGADISFTDDRVEMRRGPVMEAYDVQVEGIEQTFVLARNPGVVGDLTITGRVDTALRSCDVVARHGGLVFRGPAGEEVVRYGAAFALDAAGRRVQLATSFEDGRITLHVDAEWLETAQYPVTIDPLVSNMLMGSESSPVVGADVFFEELQSAVLVALIRAVSASDTDIYARNYGFDFGGGGLQFANLTTTYSCYKPKFASTFGPVTMGPGGRWIVVFEAQTSGIPSHFIGYHVHVTSNPLYDPTMGVFSMPFTLSRRNPDVGGSRAGVLNNEVLMVCEEDDDSGNETSSTALRLVRFDLVTQTETMTHRIGVVGDTRDRERPTVQEAVSSQVEPWLFVWQEYDYASSGDDWDLRSATMSRTGSAPPLHHPGGLGASSDDVHSLSPQVAGEDGNYMVTYCTLNNTGMPTSLKTGPQVRATQFEAAVAPFSVRHDFMVRGGISHYTNIGLAYDWRTRGHWAALTHWTNGVFGASSMYLDRVVEDDVVESHTVSVDLELVRGLGIMFDRFVGRFRTIYTAPSTELRRVALTHPAVTPATAFGSGCGGVQITGQGDPLAGFQGFAVGLEGARPSVAATLMISRATLTYPLDPLGFHGCTLYVDLSANFLGAVPTMAAASGDALLQLPLPPGFEGELRFQYASVDPTLAGGIGFSDGLVAYVVR